jgi:hypothetical protein
VAASACVSISPSLSSGSDGEFELVGDLLAKLGGLTKLRPPRLGERELQPFDRETEAGAFALDFDEIR